MTDSIETAITVYIVGVPATGKTTLITALAEHLKNTCPQVSLAVVSEVAREIVLSKGITQDVIREGGDSAIDLQRCILETQLVREVETASRAHLILSDRSGVDPIVFATKYGNPVHGQTLLDLDTWTVLRERMQQGLVILCEPVPQWFVADGVRVVPASATEYDDLHQTFLDILRSQFIPFQLLTASTQALKERVQFVMDCLKEQHHIV